MPSPKMPSPKMKNPNILKPKMKPQNDKSQNARPKKWILLSPFSIPKALPDASALVTRKMESTMQRTAKS